MHACSIYRMYFFKAGNLLLNCSAGNGMYQLPETGIFLWWPSYNGKWPDGIFLCIHFMYFHQREQVLQAVITQVVTERAFGFIFTGIYFSRYYKICISADAITIFVSIAKPPSTKYAGEFHLTDPFR